MIKLKVVTPTLTLVCSSVLVACAADHDGSQFDFGVAGDSIDTTGSGGEPEGLDDGEVTPPDLGDGDGDGDGDVDNDSDSCMTAQVSANLVRQNVVLVLDKSYSMVSNDFDHDGDAATSSVTRWAALHDVVSNVAPAYEGVANLGVALFPSMSATSIHEEACIVDDSLEVPVAETNAAAILAAIPGASETDLYGATPTAAGITNAVEHLVAVDDGRPAAIVLVTDGASNCGVGEDMMARFETYDENLPVVVDDAFSDLGIPTYVVGIDIQAESYFPQTQPRDRLNELAILGGVPNTGGADSFFDATNGVELAAALDKIADDVACTVQVDQLEGYAELMNAVIGGQNFDQLDSCDDGSGYVLNFDGETYTLEFCQLACEALVEAEGALEVGFACPPVG
jgi:hypothetical protein